MKKNNTQWIQYRGLIVFSLLLTMQLSLSAQTSHSVGVSNNTFTPKTLTIYVGDTVVWTNTQGNHNVNGTTATYPTNPESFGNSVAGPGWVFSHVFTKTGEYDYQCDPHVNRGMLGKVIVVERTLHHVVVAAGTFTPKILTIGVGDTVVWTNTQGDHNVNGTIGTYPSNPESFGNDVAGPGWVFSHVFTKAGVYDYQCDPHVAWGMVGKVIVLEQTSHAVVVAAGTFTPKNLTIHIGDTVVWTNTQGDHNVNGSTAIYPSNPESFGNDVAGPGWVFSHVFTMAGVYDYQCDPHVAWGMVGTVTVLERTLHLVVVSNGKYTPKNLTVNVGDTVVWTNTQGDHNVNGTMGTYPSNPESFGNDVAGPGWDFSHVFTKAGVYDYQCDPHVAWGMVGQITAVGTTSSRLELKDEFFDISIYPNPVVDQLTVSSEKNIESISVHSVSGAKVLEYRKINKAKLEISLVGIKAGIYFVDVQFDDNTSKVSRLIKR